ncbi:hypothetical protein VTH82DRAFT_3049 [Thermothelomyces myriococcoides]
MLLSQPATSTRRSQRRAPTGRFARATEGDSEEEEVESSVREEMRIVFRNLQEAENTLAGTEFDPFADDEIIKSGIFNPAANVAIRPVKDCLARARWECRGNREMLVRTCHWIRRYHQKASGDTFASNPALRSLKERLETACKVYYTTGVVPAGMPETEELLAVRICSPKGEVNPLVDSYLAELGYLHYGPRAPIQHVFPRLMAQATPKQASAQNDENNEDFAKRRQLATESDLLTVAETMVERHDKSIAKATRAINAVKEELGGPRETSTVGIDGHKDEMDKRLCRLEEVVARLSDEVEAVIQQQAPTHEASSGSTTRSQQPATGQKRSRPDTPTQETPARRRAASTVHGSRPAVQDTQARARTLARPRQGRLSVRDFVRDVRRRDEQEE